MSASLLVDLGNTCILAPTITGGGPGSGNIYAASGAVIGQVCDLVNGNTNCNVMVAGLPLFTSGQLRIQVQVSDSTTSGSFVDPTSGLAALPSAFQSGGILVINSGAIGGGVLGAVTSGQSIQSGFACAGSFVRTGRYARANVLSGDFYAGPLSVNFVTQQKVTGSGFGFTLAPTSGAINV